ncbi:unnamed protein product, partial [Sphacelaria rigidula]
LVTQGKYDKARAMFERALNIRESALGPVHPDVAASLNDLGWLLRLQGRYEDALPLCEQALAMRKKTLGTNHPDTAISLKNLAAIWEAQVGLLNEDYLLVRICEL